MGDEAGREVDLSVSLGGFSLANPVMAASGTFGYGLEFAQFVDLNRLGGFCTKGLSLRPRTGNPVPRIVETPSGMLNAIGLENIGLKKFLDEKVPLLREYKTRVVANFFGETVGEYAEMASALADVDRVDALEMNISCPNVARGGAQFSSQAGMVEEVVGAVRRTARKFLIVKLSPNVTDIAEIARAAEGAGADALSLINTQVGMAVDLQTRRPFLANLTGGLSGPAIKPVALAMVYRAVRAVKIPVLGMGGIMRAEDALEFLVVGASAVQVGTANFIDPSATMKILDGIRAYCLEHGVKKLSDLRSPV
ncbi:MAG: dihydroorotate dehydrogenase [Nitrospinae bacterium]|nr:dihydroorotate dehydrogenase [Nitrospinota bacterium]